MTPVVAPSVSPAGRAPLLTVQLRVGAPPVSATVNEYGNPTSPAGSAAVVIDGSGTIVMPSDVEELLPLEPVTMRVRVDVPVEVGVPEKTPPGFIQIPGGR